MPEDFFTIGHATRAVGEFTELLTDAEVRLVVDVRTVPRSRTNRSLIATPSPARLPASILITGILLPLVVCGRDNERSRRASMHTGKIKVFTITRITP